MQRIPIWITLVLLLLSACGNNSPKSAGQEMDAGMKERAKAMKQLEKEQTERENAITPPPEPEQASAVNTQLGIEYMRQGRNDIALKKLLKALEQDDRNAETHNALGVLYERLGRLENAEHHYVTALRIAPGDSSAHNNFGNYLCRQQRIGEAEQQFVKAVTNPLYNTPELAYTNAGNCFIRDNQLEKADLYLQKALRANAQFAPALYQQAELRFRQKNYMEVRELLRRYEGLAQHTPQTLSLAVRNERALGDHDSEASYVLKLRAMYPDAEETKQLTTTR